MIYNIFVSILFFCFILVFGCGSANSIQQGRVSSSVSLDYSKLDIENAIKLANDKFEEALKIEDKNKRYECLKDSALNYNIVTEAQPENIDAAIKLARVYDLQNKNRNAKSSFYHALGINPKSIDANYYFGEFYYKREEYRKALYYYKNALRYGMKENADNMKKLAVIYEKFGDLKQANLYYKKLFLLNPSDEFTADKIREIESIKYQNSDYYRKGTK